MPSRRIPAHPKAQTKTLRAAATAPSLAKNKRLAITISGAVSLGSYEAGVLYEIVNAIGQHNNDAATKSEEKIEIDVIVGASAGGMTAGIATQKLLFEAGSLAEAYNNSFYRPWVRDISIQGLLALQAGESTTHSILSSNLVEAISRKHFTDRYATPQVPLVRNRHPAAAGAIRLGLALSNLNGVDYTRQMRPSGTFTYTRHQDELRSRLDSAAADQFDEFDLWDVIRRACVSCGAFPFAFRCKDLTRHKDEYGQPFLDPDMFPSDTRTFTYTDGGVFQNEPLGLAKDFVDEIDEHQDNESRFYLFVSPGARGSTLNSDFNESKATLGATLGQLLKAIQGQAQFHDWITAENVNDRIALLNDRAVGLKDALAKKKGDSGFVDFEVLAPVSDALLPILFPNGTSSVGENLADAQTRLRSQFAPEYKELVQVNGQSAAEAWIDAVLVFETAADLGAKDEMVIYGITATDSELAGADVHAFQGFCDIAFRDHDYDVGRSKAQKFIDELNAQGGGLGPIRYTQRPSIRPIDGRLNGLKIDDVDSQLRGQIASRLRECAHNLMADMNINFAERQIIDLAVVTPQIKKFLKL
jgi:predicted acylesterase/phospholipase RssA